QRNADLDHRIRLDDRRGPPAHQLLQGKGGCPGEVPETHPPHADRRAPAPRDRARRLAHPAGRAAGHPPDPAHGPDPIPRERQAGARGLRRSPPVSGKSVVVVVAVLAVIGLLAYGLLSKGGNSLAVGETAPDREMTRLVGTGSGRIADYRGHWVLVNF